MDNRLWMHQHFDMIEVLVHPESIVHSMVNFVDGSVIAQLGVPDMRGAIGFAFNYPERLHLPVEHLMLDKVGSLHFVTVDRKKFPALDLAYSAIDRGPLFGAVLNAAKEIALDKFINGDIKFLDMIKLVRRVLDTNEISHLEDHSAKNFDDILEVDLMTRQITQMTKLN